MSTLVTCALERVRSINVPVGAVKVGKITTATALFYTEFGTITFQFVAGEIGKGVDRYEEPYPVCIYSPAVQEALGFIDKVAQQYRVAVFGETRDTRRYVLEAVLLTDDEKTAILSLELHDNHFNRVEAERISRQRQISGTIVRYTGETVPWDGEPHLKLQIVWSGTLEDYIASSGAKVIMRQAVGHANSGVHRIAPERDWTDTWGYLMIGDPEAAVLTLSYHIQSEFVVAF